MGKGKRQILPGQVGEEDFPEAMSSFPEGAAFHQAEAAGKPCGRQCALIKAGTDGLSYFPIQIPTEVLFPGVLLCFIISFKPSL